jgi:hypothetical protein
MTEPTAKLNAESNGQQETITTAKKESNVDKNTAVENPHVGKEAPKNEPVDTPDKAALLTMFTLSDIEAVATEAVISESSDSLTVAAKPVAQETNVATQRVALYRVQHERTRLLYMASANTRPTYLVQTLKPQFAEYQQYLLAQQLDKRGLMDTDTLERLWQQLHVVDDIIADIVLHMPAQQPAGWQLTTQDGRNPLCFATVGKLKHGKPIRDQGSLNSYVLGHFGVSSFTYDRGYYIGHVVGYLFSCYYCAHLSITYGVTALGQQVVADYDYASLETPHMVRLLQGLDGYCKKRIYQLAVICARLSVFASDKRIERMLIAEVNDFDKKLQQQHLDVLLLQGLMPDSNDSTPLF